MIKQFEYCKSKKIFRSNLEIHTLIIAAVSVFMVSIDMAMVNSATPAISTALKLTPNQASLVLLSYYLALSSTIIIFGKLSDTIGVIKIFQVGCGFFVIGSLLSGISINLYTLVIFRFLQGIGGAMLFPIHSTIITKFLPKQHSGKFFGIITFFTGAGYAIGFILGGILCNLDWRMIFFVNIPFGVFALIIGKRVLKKLVHNKYSYRSQALNYYSFSLNFILLLVLTYFLNQYLYLSVTQRIVACFIICIVIVIFLFRIKNRKSNFVRLEIFKNYHLIMPIIAVMIANIFFDGFIFISPFYLSIIKKISYSKIGFILALFPISSMLVGPIAGVYLDKIGSSALCIFASLLMILSSILFYFLSPYSSLEYFILVFVCFGISIAVFFTANIKLIMSYAANDEEGVISSLKASVSYFGGVIGFSIFAQMLSNSVLISNFKNACKFGVLLACAVLIICLLQNGFCRKFGLKRIKCSNSWQMKGTKP